MKSRVKSTQDDFYVGSPVYLDTCVYNHLRDTLKTPDYRKLALYHEKRGEQICLSPINIVEFVQCEDGLQREGVIWVAQSMCGKNLLAEVEAIVIDFIVRTGGLAGKMNELLLETPYHSGDMARTWNNVCKDSRKTFSVCGQGIECFDLVKKLLACFQAILARGGTINDLLKYIPFCYASRTEFASSFDDALVDARKGKVKDFRHMRIVEGIAFWVLLLLCVGLTPFPQRVDKFWDCLGIKSAVDRYEFLKLELDFVFQKGPLVGMGATAAWQARSRYSQGNFFDCYHIAYLSEVSSFFTLDSRLLDFARKYSTATNMSKIKKFKLVVG